MDKSIDVSSKEKWTSVPAFGDWEKMQMQGGMMPDYSMDFSKIRENRKQSKSDYSRISMGSEVDLILSQSMPASAVARPVIINVHQKQTSPSPGRKTFISYFACCGMNIPS